MENLKEFLTLENLKELLVWENILAVGTFILKPIIMY